MEPITAFLWGLFTLIALTTGALVCIQRPLDAILTELCGAGHRARFWARLYDATLFCLVIFFCLWAPPEGESVGLLDLLAMLRGGLLGLLAGLGVLAVAMLAFILRHEDRQRRRPSLPDVRREA